MGDEEGYSSDEWCHVPHAKEKNSSDESFVEVGYSSSENDDKIDEGNRLVCVVETDPTIKDDEKSYSSDHEPYNYLIDDDDKSISSNSEYGIMDSSSSAIDDIFDKALQHYAIYSDCTIPNPQIPKKRKEMEIKDIAKDSILPFLPAKALVKFQSVSKEWEQRIKNPFLAHEQSYHFKELSGFFHQSSWRNPKFVSLNKHAYGVPEPYLTFLPEKVNIISSSNGLILCKGKDERNSYYICNPSNIEWAELPQPEFYHGPDSATVLAFEPSVLNMEAHYQVISAVPLMNQSIVSFEIYSSETKSWRVSTSFYIGDLSFTGTGLYTKGIAYFETSNKEVLAFDFKNEIHGVITLPEESSPGGVLAQIGDEMCYINVTRVLGNEYAISIYGGGVELGLVRSINVNLGSYEYEGLGRFRDYRVLPSVDGEKVMILVGKIVYCYSLVDGKIEKTSMDGVMEVSSSSWDEDGVIKFLPYVNSLVHVAY